MFLISEHSWAPIRCGPPYRTLYSAAYTVEHYVQWGSNFKHSRKCVFYTKYWSATPKPMESMVDGNRRIACWLGSAHFCQNPLVSVLPLIQFTADTAVLILEPSQHFDQIQQLVYHSTFDTQRAPDLLCTLFWTHPSKWRVQSERLAVLPQPLFQVKQTFKQQYNAWGRTLKFLMILVWST